MKNIKLYLPKKTELDFAKNLLNDPPTMAYNKGYDLPFPGYNKNTGCIFLDDTYWEKWYDLYFSHPEAYFYAYIYDQDLKTFVGDVNFHPSELNPNARNIGIVIKDEFRDQGYGKFGLRLLIKKAFSFDSIKILNNNFEKDRTFALKLHTRLGFKVIKESNEILYLELINKIDI